MVTISFDMAGQEILRLAVSADGTVQTHGDASWLDYAFQPPSVALGRPVSFTEDPCEWARSLPHAYTDSSSVRAVVLSDMTPAPAAPVFAAPAGAGMQPAAPVATTPAVRQMPSATAVVSAPPAVSAPADFPPAGEELPVMRVPAIGGPPSLAAAGAVALALAGLSGLVAHLLQSQTSPRAVGALGLAFAAAAAVAHLLLEARAHRVASRLSFLFAFPCFAPSLFVLIMPTASLDAGSWRTAAAVSLIGAAAACAGLWMAGNYDRWLFVGAVQAVLGMMVLVSGSWQDWPHALIALAAAGGAAYAGWAGLAGRAAWASAAVFVIVGAVLIPEQGPVVSAAVVFALASALVIIADRSDDALTAALAYLGLVIIAALAASGDSILLPGLMLAAGAVVAYLTFSGPRQFALPALALAVVACVAISAQQKLTVDTDKLPSGVPNSSGLLGGVPSLGQQDRAAAGQAKQMLSVVYKDAKAEQISNNGRFPSRARLRARIAAAEPQYRIDVADSPQRATTPGVIYIIEASGDDLLLAANDGSRTHVLTVQGGAPTFTELGS